MRVLVTGATGFVGSWVARELVAAGHAVRILVRAGSNRKNIEGLDVEPREGDILDAASVARAAEGCEGIVHTAGLSHFPPGGERRLYQVNVGGADAVFAAALEAGVERAVITSSVAAMGGTRTPEVRDESSPSVAEGSGVHYMISKWRGERAALAYAGRGMSVVAVRPCVLLGPGDIYHSSTSTILALARRKVPAYVPGGASWSDVRDVARAHVAALDRGRSGEAYILGGENIEVSDLVSRVARAAGVPPPRRAPYAVAYAAATAIELLCRLTGRHADVSRQLLRASSLYTFVTSAKAARELDYRVRPFDESLRDTLRHYLDAGRLEPATRALRAVASPAPASRL